MEYKMIKSINYKLNLLVSSVVCLLALVMFQACEPGPQKINFSITAVDTNNLPVSGVYIYLSSYEAAWGATDTDGRFQGESVAKVGDTLSFRLEAPEGYTLIPSQDTSFQVTENDQPLLVEYTGQFKPPKREYLFMVEGKPDDQILINNQDIASLDASGRSSILYSGAPGEEFIIQVGVQGYRGILSTGKEVYLITPEKQGALLDPDLFMGSLQAAPESGDDPSLALPSESESQEELDSSADDSEEEETVAIAVPKPAPRSKAKTRRSNRSSAKSKQRSTRSRSRSSRSYRENRKTPKRKPVRSNSYERKSSAYTVELDEPKRSAPPVPPPRTRYNEPKRTQSSSRGSSYNGSGSSRTSRKSSYSGSNNSSAGEVLSSLKTQTRSRSNSRSRYNSNSGSGSNSGSSYNSRPSSVSRSSKKTSTVVTPVPSGGLDSMSKKDIKAKLKEIEKRYERSNRLTAQDVSFLKMLNKKHGISYYSAHRLLGYFYFSLNDIRRQKDSLTIAVKKGRYKHDPNVLLSLAQAYGHFKQYTSAIKYLRRAESKMNRMKGAGKANVYRTYAEYLRLKYVSQKARNPLQADTGLLDKAIQKWKNLLTLSGGGGRDGSDARTQIAKLEKMKAEAGGL